MDNKEQNRSKPQNLHRNPYQKVIPAYNKPHKFFRVTLDNDLDDLSAFLHEKHKQISDIPLRDDEKFVESNSITTIKWREYNVFQFHHKGIHKVLKGVKQGVLDACEYYGVDFNAQQYMIQGWFNINNNRGKDGKLDWHDHGRPWAPNFHGYYCIKAEPSVTWYRINDFNEKTITEVENHNVDNVLIVSEMGHEHAMAEWEWDGPRITLAYDIAPLGSLIAGKATEQHWFPLV
jgi:hypothetical protein